MSYVSYTERLFEKARETFGKDVYKAWPQIAYEYEHALWRVWNLNYGPLNDAQLTYATDLICHALEKTQDAENPYAAFKHHLRRLYHHETVARGFATRAQTGWALGDIGFAGVPAA